MFWKGTDNETKNLLFVEVEDDKEGSVVSQTLHVCEDPQWLKTYRDNDESEKNWMKD